ncbi:uncharacterized protein LOC114841057 [Diachasma alloeum]|uniref:uncharacterized protein LOC114841057 n=1 Tax=Diachasma alloeum TaxID=454923 RepID=UPI0010FB2D2E|nr:uncharacterized protein LOC114841057 [Diachasma alloeum]
MNMNPQSRDLKTPKRSKRINSAPPKPRNAKASDVTVDSDVINTTARPCGVDSNSRELSELITWKQIAASPTVSASFDDKRQPEWTRSVEKLDRTYLIKESREVCLARVRPDSSYAITPPRMEEFPAAGGDKSFVVDRNEEINDKTPLSPPRPIDLWEFSKITRIPPIKISDAIPMTADSLDSARSSGNFVRKRLRKKMNLLRESTDSLVSSFDASNDNAQPDNSSGDKFQVLPSVAGVPREPPFRQGRRRVSYWERAVRNSKNRLGTLALRRLEPSRNPLILPPVISLHQR